MKRNCYACPRKGECYTEEGLANLTPDTEQECGALYTNFYEAQEFILVLGNLINNLDTEDKSKIIASLAMVYDCDIYTALGELNL